MLASGGVCGNRHLLPDAVELLQHKGRVRHTPDRLRHIVIPVDELHATEAIVVTRTLSDPSAHGCMELREGNDCSCCRGCLR